MKFPIVIVGAGAAGVGLGVLFKHLDLPFVIIEQGKIGESFTRWPKETQFISPSFTGNSFGAVDLNSVTPDTSPAFSLQTEHPTGAAYAAYLYTLVEHFELPFAGDIYVEDVIYDKNSEHQFKLKTSKGNTSCNYLIWAAGEFQYPNRKGFEGAQFCTHYADVQTWKDLEGDEFFVIGSYESGVDAAYQLAKLGKKVTLFDGNDQLGNHTSDSSYSISPFTRDRFRTVAANVRVITTKITKVEEFDDGFTLSTSDGEKYASYTKPINCIGFETSLSKVKHLFEFDQGDILLTDTDESTICPNLFLAGPQVKHGEAIFCFIYKYRQRFGIIGEALSQRLNGDAKLREEIIEFYKQNQFYLDDLSCCEDECAC